MRKTESPVLAPVTVTAEEVVDARAAMLAGSMVAVPLLKKSIAEDDVPRTVEDADRDGVINVLVTLSVPMVEACTVSLLIAAVEVALSVATLRVVRLPVTPVKVVKTSVAIVPSVPARAAVIAVMVFRGYGVVSVDI